MCTFFSHKAIVPVHENLIFIAYAIIPKVISTEAYIRHHLLLKSVRKRLFFALNILFFLALILTFSICFT